MHAIGFSGKIWTKGLKMPSGQYKHLPVNDTIVIVLGYIHSIT